MKSTPFHVEKDLPPIPFDERHCRLAQSLKEAGLPWKPHVGCFVWDPRGVIGVDSPFPGRIYFILNLGHFLKIFGTVEQMIEDLVWLPTWHQGRLLCAPYGVNEAEVSAIWSGPEPLRPGDDVAGLYQLLRHRLKSGGRQGKQSTS